MTIQRDIHQANRLSWNAGTRAHNSHKGDQAAFFRDGGSTLFSEELELLGDIAGQSLVHLMCNAGQDTLSLARHGAEVLGVDISDEAVAFATALSRDSGIAGRFERADVYDWLADTDESFDNAYMSYGAMTWLSDLAGWARGVARILKPGGRLVLLEFHPVLFIFEEVEDDSVLDRLRVRFPYSGGEHMSFDDGVSDYVALSGEGLTPQGYKEGVVDFRNPHGCHEFAWGVEETVGALLGAGLQLTALREYPYTTGYKPYSIMRAVGDRRYAFVDEIPRLPLMFGVVAEKPR